MRFPAFSFVVSLLATINGFSQSIYDDRLVSAEQELNLTVTDQRGIKGADGIVYLVERDGQTITAYSGEQIKWTVNIIKTCGVPTIGEPQIRNLKLMRDKIEITFGKHSFASVDFADFKTTCSGSD